MGRWSKDARNHPLPKVNPLQPFFSHFACGFFIVCTGTGNCLLEDRQCVCLGGSMRKNPHSSFATHSAAECCLGDKTHFNHWCSSNSDFPWAQLSPASAAADHSLCGGRGVSQQPRSSLPKSSSLWASPGLKPCMKWFGI